jgi:hypothetical protein
LLKKLWADPVWSKVIAGLILTAGAALGAYLLDWWPNIGNGLKKAYEFAAAPTLVPNWLLGLLIMLSLPIILLAGLAVWMRLFPSKEAGPGWHSYTSDKFFGLLWRWRYLSDGQIYDVCTFCPRCDYQVYPENVSAYSVVDRIGFRCDSCGSQLGEFDESALSLENKVKRFVQQKLRNGTWVVPNRA